jgi:hypothetical protein
MSKIDLNYDKLIQEYENEYPDWLKYFTDSTYYELMSWYEYKHGIETSDEEPYSDEAHNFANYVYEKVHENDVIDIIVCPSSRGDGYYYINNLTKGDLLTLSNLIDSGSITDKRQFFGLKTRIEKILKNG